MSPLVRRVYYGLKPLLPRSVRWMGRRIVARRILKTSREIWPINPKAGEKPAGWSGWPDGRDFAVVLTHDVEGQHGVDQVKTLAQLELEEGFKSSFNFIPEGGYVVPTELRGWLESHGFEVGVHDLHHEGHLFDSRESFRRQAERINSYLADWRAVGFRAGFMLHRLDWMHDLEVEYDLSTFDTDPFEPQPDAAGTIFPFFIPYEGQKDERTNGRKDTGGSAQSRTIPSTILPSDGSPLDRRPPRAGYVELPYTLPQDSTLFLLMRHRTSDLWRTKVQWLVSKGGMVLVNVHPDYIDFGDGRTPTPNFSASIYRDFLRHIRKTYDERYWHGTARELARWYVGHRCGSAGASASTRK